MKTGKSCAAWSSDLLSVSFVSSTCVLQDLARAQNRSCLVVSCTDYKFAQKMPSFPRGNVKFCTSPFPEISDSPFCPRLNNPFITLLIHPQLHHLIPPSLPDLLPEKRIRLHTLPPRTRSGAHDLAPLFVLPIYGAQRLVILPARSVVRCASPDVQPAEIPAEGGFAVGDDLVAVHVHGQSRCGLVVGYLYDAAAVLEEVLQDGEMRLGKKEEVSFLVIS